MTRIEKVMSEYGKMHTKKKIMQYCPGNWIRGAPKIDIDGETFIVKNSKFIGCRGITCEECWGQEAYKEAANDQA